MCTGALLFEDLNVPFDFIQAVVQEVMLSLHSLSLCLSVSLSLNGPSTYSIVECGHIICSKLNVKGSLLG